MQIIRNILLLTFMTFTTGVFSQVSQQLPDSLKILQGQVIDNVSGENFPLVLVTIFFSETEFKSVRCDFDGKFILYIPMDKELTTKSYLEFISFNYKPLVIKGNIDNIKNLTVELEFDPKGQITKDDYEKLCKERYDYANECGAKE